MTQEIPTENPETPLASDPARGEKPGGVIALSLFLGAILPELYYEARPVASDWENFYQPAKGLWKLPLHQIRPEAIFFPLVAFAAIIYFVAQRLMSQIKPPSWKFCLSQKQNVIAQVVIALALSFAIGLLFFHWSVTPPMLGDSVFWQMLADNPFIMGSEPLGRWSHYLAYQLLTLFDVYDRKLGVRLSSALAGAFDLAGVMLLVRAALPRLPRFAGIMFLFLSPTALLFIGYPEATPWAYAFTEIYLLAGVRYLRLSLARPPWLETLFIMFAVWTHGMACFATGAQLSLLLIWFFRKLDEDAPARWSVRRVALGLSLAALTFVPLGGTLLFAYLFGTGLPASPWQGNMGGGKDNWPWVSFSEAGAATHPLVIAQYIFFDKRYRSDLFNLILSACPLLFALPLALAQIAKFARTEILFVGSALAGLLLFTLFWNADLGMQFDFDLMAMFAVPAQLLAALWLERKLEAKSQNFVCLVIAFTTFCFTLLPFINFP